MPPQNIRQKEKRKGRGEERRGWLVDWSRDPLMNEYNVVGEVEIKPEGTYL